MSRVYISTALALTAALAALPGCILDASTVTQAPVGTSVADSRAPIIAALDYSPKVAIGKNDFVSFTVVATAPSGKPLQYTWTSTKGMLTGNTGSTVAWRPTRADGSFEAGLSTVTLVVSDGTFTSSANVNILISATGDATISKVDIPSAGAGAASSPGVSAPSTRPSTAPTPRPSAAPTPVPTLGPTPEPSVVPTAVPTLAPTPTAPIGSPVTGTPELLYRQIDFRERYTHARKEGPVKLDGVPIGGYGEELSPITWLSMGGTPDGDKAYPNKFFWDVANFESSAILLGTNLAWWGDNMKGETIAKVTLEGAGGEKQAFDMVVGTHTAEWNGGSIAENPPAVRFTGPGAGNPESRMFVARYDYPSMAVSRVTVELLKAPMWNSTQYAVMEIHGMTLWGGWKY